MKCYKLFHVTSIYAWILDKIHPPLNSCMNFDDQPLNLNQNNQLNEYPDDNQEIDTFQLPPPGQILESCQSKNTTQRRKTYEAILSLAVDQQNINPCLEIAPQIASLIKESNVLIQQKVLQILEILLHAQAISNIGQVIKSLCDNSLGNQKQVMKDLNIKVFKLLAQNNLDIVIESVSKTLGSKQVKQSIEGIQILYEILKSIQDKNILTQDFIQNFILQIFPGFQHKDQTIRKICTDILVYFSNYMNGTLILKILQQNKLPKTNLQAIEELLQQQQETSSGSMRVSNSQQNQGNKLIKFYPIVSNPVNVSLPKNFYDQLKASQWKTRKEVLQNLLDQMQQINNCNIVDLKNLTNTLILFLQQELNVYNTGLAYRALAQIVVKTNLQTINLNPKQLLNVSLNRVKERKYAVIQGFQIFSQSLLIRAYNIKDIVFEFLSTAIPHKNPEVKEDFCRFLKVVYATSIVYNSQFADPKNRSSENTLIKQISNDTYPNCQYLNTEEIIPEEGEKSYGMQLNTRLERQMSATNAIFATFINNGGEVNFEPIIYEQQMIQFAQQMDKLLNDIQDNIRQLAKRMFCLFAMAHIAEAWDCVQRSDNAQQVVQAYNQMYNLIYDIIHQHKRRQEFLILIEQYARDCQMLDLFSRLLDQSGLQQVETRPQLQPVINIQPSGINVQQNIIQQQEIQTQEIPTTEQFKPTKQQLTQYNQRASNQIKFTFDPFNIRSPVNSHCLEEFYNQLQQYITPQLASKLFVKQITKQYPNIQATGDLKSVNETVQYIIQQYNNSDQMYLMIRDLILRYANIILCDGVMVNSAPTPPIIKLSIELIQTITAACVQNGIKFTMHDIECGTIILAGKLEQQNSPQMRQQVMNTLEMFYNNCESPLDFLQFMIENLIGKGARYLIRQVITKVSITRFTLAVAVQCYLNGLQFDKLSIPMGSNLTSQMQSFGVEIFQISDCTLTSKIQLKVSNAKQIAAALIGLVLEMACHCENGRRFANLVEKTCSGEMNFIQSIINDIRDQRHQLQTQNSKQQIEAMHMQSDAQNQLQNIQNAPQSVYNQVQQGQYGIQQPQTQSLQNQVTEYQPFNIQTVQHVKQSPQNHYQTPFAQQIQSKHNTQTFQLNPQAFDQNNGFQGKVVSYQNNQVQQNNQPITVQNLQHTYEQQNNQEFFLNSPNTSQKYPVITYQPFKTPQSNQHNTLYPQSATRQSLRKSVHFADDNALIKKDIENVEDMPDQLIDISKLNFEIYNEQFVNSRVNDPMNNTQRANETEQQLLQELFEPQPESMIVRRINQIKQLINYMRLPKTNRSYKLISQTTQVVKQLSFIIRQHLPNRLYSEIFMQRIIHDQYLVNNLFKLVKYYYIAINQMFVNQESLMNQEEVIKVVIEDAIFTTIVIEQLNSQNQKELMGLNQGLINTIFNICNIEKVYCGLIHLLSIFNISRINSTKNVNVNLSPNKFISQSILQNVDNSFYNFCNTYLINIININVELLYNEMNKAAGFRINHANNIFDNSDLNSGDLGSLKSKWKDLEKTFPDFMKQLSSQKPSYFENLLFQIHLFLLKQRDANYQSNAPLEKEYKVIRDLIVGFHQEVGEAIYLFLQKIPNISCVELRQILEQ